jgi:hypothetical protein
MTALLTPPRASDVEAQGTGRAPAPRRPGRWGHVLAGTLLLGGLVWSLLLWLPSAVAVSTGETRFTGSADVVTVPGYGPHGTHIVDYRDGVDLTVTVPVRNDGPLAMEVTSASAGTGLLPLLTVQSIDGLPLALGPGEQGEVVLHARLQNCAYYHEREVQNVRDLTLATQVGIGPVRREVEVALPLDRPLLVHSPMIIDCPQRKIDRQANNRRNAL